MSNKSIEVIMAAYNQVLNTKIVLDGYLRQREKSFSICIADDGSGSQIKKLVDCYQSMGLNIRHVWHEDKGFRRAEILNKAIASSSADYIILTDNDCIPSKHFVSDYLETLDDGHLFIGRRVDLYAPVTNRIKENELSLRLLENPAYLVTQSLIKGLKRPEMAIRFPEFICRLWNRKQRPALGANMAASRKALLAVNGFDNDYQGYGLEESDLEWRLLATGLKRKSVLGRCALFHLYHPTKEGSQAAVDMYDRKKAEGKVVCDNGITVTEHAQ